MEFLDEPDFGLPESFAPSLPSGLLLPGLPVPGASVSTNRVAATDPTNVSEIISDGFCFKLAPTTEPHRFVESMRNSEKDLTNFKKGTTTLAFEFQGGVLIAVDSRATMGALISSHTVRKVIEINDFLLGTMAGGAADCQFWERDLTRQCRLFQLRNNERITVAGASKLLASIFWNYRGYGLSCGTMVAGSDEDGSTALYYVDDKANRLRGRIFSVGSGSTFAYGVIDSGYDWNMSVEDAVNLGVRAISSATYRDAGSGGVVRIYHVHSQGWTKVHDKIDVSELHYEYNRSKGFRGDGKEFMNEQPQL